MEKVKKTVIYYQVNDDKNEVRVTEENGITKTYEKTESLLESVKKQTQKIIKIEELEEKIIVYYYLGENNIKKHSFVNNENIKNNLNKIMEDQKKAIIVYKQPEKKKVIAKKKNNNQTLKNILIAVASVAIIVSFVKGCSKDKEPTEIINEDTDKEMNEVIEDLEKFVKEINDMGLYDESGKKGLTVEQILNFWMVQNYTELSAKKYAFLYKDSLTSTEVMKNADRTTAYITGFSVFEGKDIDLKDYILNEMDSEYIEKIQNEIKVLKDNLKNPEIKSQQQSKLNGIFRELHINTNSLTSRGNYLIINYIYELNNIINIDEIVSQRTIRNLIENCEDSVQNNYDIAKENSKLGFTEWFESIKTYKVESKYDRIIKEITLGLSFVNLENQLDMETESLKQKTEEQKNIVKETQNKTTTESKKVSEKVVKVETSNAKTKEEINAANKNEEIYWSSYTLGNNKGVSDAIKDNKLGNSLNYNPKSHLSNIGNEAAYEKGYKKAYNETKQTYKEAEKAVKENPDAVKVDENTWIIIEEGMGYDQNGNPIIIDEDNKQQTQNNTGEVIIDPESDGINLGLEPEPTGTSKTK